MPDPDDDALNPQLAHLERQLRAPSLIDRKIALDQLATLPSDQAVPILQRLLQENEVILRRLAVMGLGNHRSEASFQILQALIDTEQDGNILAEAANSLFEFGDRAIPILQALFERAPHWLLRQTILSILVETTHYQALFELALLALDDETQAVKEVGILALNQVLNSPLKDQALDALATLAESPDWRSRWRTAIALQNCTDPRATTLLAKLQTDEHYRVVAAALEVASQSQSGN
jgi:HEAT repeat protein